ncbi:hypothetical protein HOU02_gp387 [Caulobacter phage CcrBL9]|uniref:Uncharacterized protein n=1 Tax=Caulobacter phage CcrBL9 TaxID=2283270 RepID=A0A385EEZ2_9CAUD|nr:hypothetical protein HOU02_gp387 [Caulobacter phage CcrBL9]AXQ69338.1 hypothetical protein CcrBL9_gp314 [Caulobacter phage CcrBL9]
MTDETETETEHALYYALVAGAAEYDGLPAVLLAVWAENDKTVTGRVVEQIYTYNNNITHVTKPDQKFAFMGGRQGTGLYRASKNKLLATFADKATAEDATFKAKTIASVQVDEFGESAKIKDILHRAGELEQQARKLREEVRPLRAAAWKERFQQVLGTLRDAGASHVWAPPEDVTA